MFFLRKRNYQQCQKSFSTAYRNIPDASIVIHKHPLMCRNKRRARRTVFAPLIFVASMTLEATMLLPVFLFCMLNLYLIIDMIRLQAVVSWNLQQIGDKISAYGYLAQAVLRIEEQDDILDAALDAGTAYLYVRNQMQKLVVFPDKVFVTTASVLEEGKVELTLTYNYPLFVAVGGSKDIWLQSSYFGYAWGDSNNEQGSSTVYITANGEVYHTYLDCSHLNVTVMELPTEQLAYFSGEQGGEFLLCLKCGQSKASSMIYLTIEQGRIHYDKDCAGLKRDIVAKELEEVKGVYKPCSRCEERE